MEDETQEEKQKRFDLIREANNRDLSGVAKVRERTTVAVNSNKEGTISHLKIDGVVAERFFINGEEWVKKEKPQ